MDLEMEMPVDDLEALFAEDDEEIFGDAAPTNTCTQQGQTCGS